MIIPTLGRSTLARTLFALVGQPWPSDEVIVVGDGCCPARIRAAVPPGLTVRHLSTDGGPHRDGGATARNLGQNAATGKWLAFCDDDDALVPNALDMIREHVLGGPRVPHVFQMVHVYGGQVYPYRGNVVERGNIGSPMLVVPNDDRTPDWPPGPCADGKYAEEWLRVVPADQWVWVQKVIVNVWPPRHGKR